MNEFGIWFKAGFEHILEISAYDHFLFIALLVISVPHRHWLKILLLILGFTAGHTLSLAITVVKGISLPSSLTEVLIAATLVVTALYDLFSIRFKEEKKFILKVSVVILFGLIHGMGFSFSLRALLGAEQNLVLPLLYFNAGLEAGQLIIVAVILLFSVFLAGSTEKGQHYFKFIFACICLLVSLSILFYRLRDLFSA